MPQGDPGAMMATRWRAKFCCRNAEGKTVADPGKLRLALDEMYNRVVRICEAQKDGTIRGTEGTGEFERYTPSRYIEAARLALGAIDLDPASSPEAQRTVKAFRFFTARDDGLLGSWTGRVFLNPPYHRELMPAFMHKLLVEVGEGRTTAAIALTNNSTDTEWAQAALGACTALCFTDGRVPFTTPGGAVVSPTQGQMFLYFGPNEDAFASAFHDIGVCIIPAA